MKLCKFVIPLIILSLFSTGFQWAAKSSDSDESVSKEVVVGDIKMSYKVFGAGYPIILIMGYSGTQDMWDTEFIDLLKENYKVITFDNRGMGETTAGSKSFTIEQMADDTAGLLDALGIEKAHVLAWSMGTNIALELVLRHPQKVNKLVLYAADCGGKEAVQSSPAVWQKLTDTSVSEEKRQEVLLGLMFPAAWLLENPDPSKYFPEITEHSSAENINRQTVAMTNWQGAYTRLSQITQKTLLVTGTEDVLTPPENSMIILERMPSAWLAQITGGGHGVMYQYPMKFTKAVISFLY